jgi:hypothetical protein
MIEQRLTRFRLRRFGLLSLLLLPLLVLCQRTNEAAQKGGAEGGSLHRFVTEPRFGDLREVCGA